MLTDKMKEVQLVAESKLLKIDPTASTFSRYDKTVFIIEPAPSSIKLSGMEIKYVEAAKFFSLLPDAKIVELTTDYCHIILSNGAEYKLPYFDLTWEDQVAELPEQPTAKIKLAAGRLSSATLKNLANPMLQCIYIDEATAVSCNSMVACIDGTVTSRTPLILPPDIISIIEGAESNLYLIDDNYVLAIGDSKLFVPVPELDYSETAEVLRSALPEGIERYPVGALLESLKRLSNSHDFVSFQADRVIADDDYEPFDFPRANPNYQYNIQNLLSTVGQAKTIAQSDYALLLYGDQFLFMISPEPTGEEEEYEEYAEEE